MSNKYIIVLVVVLLIIVGGFYFFSNQNHNTVAPANTQGLAVDNGAPAIVTTKMPAPSPVAPQVIHNVTISNSAFVPATITVKKNETIIWTNKDTVPHTVTGGDLLSNPLGQSETYSFAYDKTGTFAYHCSIHPSMKGTVIVTN